MKRISRDAERKKPILLISHPVLSFQGPFLLNVQIHRQYPHPPQISHLTYHNSTPRKNPISRTRKPSYNIIQTDQKDKTLHKNPETEGKAKPTNNNRPIHPLPPLPLHIHKRNRRNIISFLGPFPMLQVNPLNSALKKRNRRRNKDSQPAKRA